MKHLASSSLKPYNTFGISAQARRVVSLESPRDAEHIEFDSGRDLLLGGGSNVVFAGDVPGTVYLNRMTGRAIVDQDETSALVEAAAGENWHALVRWSLARGLSGLENLSLIPGLVGAAPMQNIGAYGVELAEVLQSVSALDLRAGEWVEFSNDQCRFAYRDSVFKSHRPDRYLITSVRLRLSRAFTPRLDYAGLAEELDAMRTGDLSAMRVSEAVVRLRRRKLPDPGAIGNAGSFFKNPVVPPDRAREAAAAHPGLPVHPVAPGAVKLSAGWMVERCGWKGYREGDAGVSERHALVLVNHGKASGRQLLELAGRIRRSVEDEFGLVLETEPKVVGHA